MRVELGHFTLGKHATFRNGLNFSKESRGQGCLLIGVPGSKGWDCDPDHKVRYDEGSLVDTGQRLGFRHLETFHTPLWRSAWLERNVRQYCIYAAFDCVD